MNYKLQREHSALSTKAFIEGKLVAVTNENLFKTLLTHKKIRGMEIISLVNSKSSYTTSFNGYFKKQTRQWY